MRFRLAVALLLPLLLWLEPQVTGEQSPSSTKVITVRELLDSVPADLLDKDGDWSALDFQDAIKHLNKTVVNHRFLIEIKLEHLSVSENPPFITIGGKVKMLNSPNFEFRGKTITVGEHKEKSLFSLPITEKVKFQKAKGGEVIHLITTPSGVGFLAGASKKELGLVVNFTTAAGKEAAGKTTVVEVFPAGK